MSDQIIYFLSPVSSVLFTMTAFRLSRVQDAIRRRDLQMWKRIILMVVSIVSFSALLLLWKGGALSNEKDMSVISVGINLDVMASCLAVIILGLGLSYSFYKYGNQLLIGLTGITFLYTIWRQYDTAQRIIREESLFNPVFNLGLAALNVASYTTLIMIFIALALAWGLSDTSRLRTVGTRVPVNIVAMFLDLRGSTRWASEMKDSNYVGAFINELREWTWSHTSMLSNNRPKLVKFLGDGFMLVWEVSDESKVEDRANSVVNLAYTLYSSYPSWAADVGDRNIWKEVPAAIGIGVDVDSATRLTFENGSEDYLGDPVNLAAKMQDKARPNGGVVIRTKVWEHLSPSTLRDKFPNSGEVQIGNRVISIRLTENVQV